MMIHYLRVEDVNGKANDSTVPPLFFNERNPYPFTVTSWNFVGQLWARAFILLYAISSFCRIR